MLINSRVPKEVYYFPTIAQRIGPGSLQLTDGSFIDQDFKLKM
jgi:hypothetical protein